MSREVKGCCSCGCLFSTAISAIFIWLAFRILTPTISVENFDAFALQSSPNSKNNNSIHYDLKLKNRNFNKGIYYDALDLTFYYKPNPGLPIGNVTIAAFYQGFWKSTHRVGDIQPAAGVKLGNGSDAVFTVELSTKVRYKSPLWKTKRRSLVVGADLNVNGQGSLIKGKGNNGIKLSSDSTQRRMTWIGLIGVLGILLSIHSL